MKIIPVIIKIAVWEINSNYLNAQVIIQFGIIISFEKGEYINIFSIIKPKWFYTYFYLSACLFWLKLSVMHRIDEELHIFTLQ